MAHACDLQSLWRDSRPVVLELLDPHMPDGSPIAGTHPELLLPSVAALRWAAIEKQEVPDPQG